MADRIQARAIKRCGELLRAIAPDEKGGGNHRKRTLTVTKAAVAEGAGLSKHQKRTALRVANVPVF